MVNNIFINFDKNLPSPPSIKSKFWEINAFNSPTRKFHITKNFIKCSNYKITTWKQKTKF